MLGTATVVGGRTLRAHVKVLRQLDEERYLVEIISGINSWNHPGKVMRVYISKTGPITPPSQG